MFDPELKYADVSVVVPCYRCCETIERAVHSVYEQTLRPVEIILVDDCSGDSTLEFLVKLQGMYPEGWVKVIAATVNSGPGTARNLGWETSIGKYIAFLDADDSWHPEKTKVQYDWMSKHSDVVLTGQIFDGVPISTGVRAIFNGFRTFNPVNLQSLMKSNKFTTSSVMLLSAIEYRFMDSKRYCEDYLLWAEICSSGLKCFSINFPLSIAYKPAYGVAGLSSNLWRMECGELFVYKHMYQGAVIGSPEFILYTSWSLLRFLRRVVISVFGLFRP